MLEEALYLWAGGSVAASAGYVIGRAQGKEAGRSEARAEHAKEAVDAYFSGKPHGDPDHWCTPECYRNVMRQS